MTDQPMPFDDLLKNDGPVAMIIKQYLRPAEGEGEPIFPPTYPMPTYRGRVHTVRDGEYRVSVELPAFRQDGSKGEKNESEDVAGYNIDEFRDGSNVCEIDSPQSQGNRLEPLFKTVKGGKLVPQVTIRAGNTVVNLLDAGHRAADAVVRLSSLVDKCHSAFAQVKRGNHSELARLAPTSLLFGVWDSRASQVKLPRIIKAEIRATNVEKLTRSAQFNPAIDYVGVGAVAEDLDKGEGEKNPLGAEGMKHVPAPRATGGVKVHGEIKRVVRINLVALRELHALDKEGALDENQTKQLQQYILGLALVAATRPLQLNLREGCLLCEEEKKTPSFKLVNRNGHEDDYPIDETKAAEYAETAAKLFFGEQYEKKDITDAIFESGVANEFLGMTADDRKKIARFGPITADAIRRYKEKGKDPLKLVSEAVKEAKKAATEKIKEAKKTDPKYRGKNAIPVVVSDAFKAIAERLDELADDSDLEQPVKDIVGELQRLIIDDKDTATTFKSLAQKIMEFNKKRKESAVAADAPDTSLMVST